MKLCVYTILTGGYEQLNEQPVAAESDVPFICFTDDPKLTSKTWQMRKLEKIFQTDTVRNQRAYKLQPHKILPEFDVSLYIDNSVLLKVRPEKIFRAFDIAAGLAIPLHGFRETLLDEFLQVTRQELDSPERVAEQLSFYRKTCPEILEERPYWSGVLIRDHRNMGMILAMETWLEQILRFSRRDQLSAPAAFAMAGFEPNTICIDNYDSWFHSWPHSVNRKAAMRHWRPAVDARAPMFAPAKVGLPIGTVTTPELLDIEYKKPGWRRWLHGLPELSRDNLGRIMLRMPHWRGRIFRLLMARFAEYLVCSVKDFLIALAPRKYPILCMEEGDAKPTACRSVALYVHYSESGSVSEMVLKQLEVYRSLGFAVVFISNAPVRLDADWAEVRERAALLIHRRNHGFDFGAWKDVLPMARARWPGAEEILLVNDSCLGPFRPLDVALQSIREAGPGMFGMQESLQGGTHLQSWFLLIRGEHAIADAAVFFERLKLSTSKWKTIQRGELRLTRRMLELGHRVRAVHAYSALLKAALGDLEQCLDLETMFFPGAALDSKMLFSSLKKRTDHVPLNPTHHLWCTLMKSPYSSFIKTELVTRNPGNVPRVKNLWKTRVPKDSVCPMEFLEAHLAQVTK